MAKNLFSIILILTSYRYHRKQLWYYRCKHCHQYYYKFL